MVDQGSGPAGSGAEHDDAEPDPRPEPAILHVASRADAVDAHGRDARLAAILTRGDTRDQAAARRDRKAAERPAVEGDSESWIEREWAARDRDAAAGDRANLVGLFRTRGSGPKPRPAEDV